MAQRFKETDRQVFTSASALSRGILRIQGKETRHFNADVSNTELLLRISHSVNQVSIYGAVSNWCEEVGQSNGLRFWQTKSNATIGAQIRAGRLHLQGNFSKKGDRTSTERFSTLRPPPRVTLWSRWQSQQHSRSSNTRRALQPALGN